ncbi:MAG: YbhB/YbcL family Raf kinase inhibitor-like protein [Acidimicrobiia bacterium]|nr:YbhB/YbcL family Raf kinase inhibitor-like protein [Acidimicrobiia bacterium]
MELRSESFSDGDPIPADYAFGVPDPDTHVSFAANRNPHLRWSEAPAGTQSFALICHDRDVPTRPDDVNQEGREVPSDLPRTDFFHWVAVDLPASLNEIAAGSFSDGVVPRGQQVAAGPHGSRQGLNDYTGWFAGDPDMEGSYFGYDGPCPPWNDSLVHHYVFTLYALDTTEVDVSGDFSGAAVREAIAGHVLAEAAITGTYTLNPRLIG